MSEVVPTPVPAETDNLLNLTEGDSPSALHVDVNDNVAPPPPQLLEDAHAVQAPAPPMEMEVAPAPVPTVHEALQKEEEAYQQEQQQQVAAPPPVPVQVVPGVHEQAFVHAAPFVETAPPPPQQPMVEEVVVQAMPPLPAEQHEGPPPLAPTLEDQDAAVVNENENNDDQDEAAKRPAEEGDADGEPPLKKKKKEPKRKGRKPGSTNKRRSAYNMDRSGPMPSWNDMFFALMAFKAKLQTFNVPAQTKLGKWVTKQRQEFSKLQRKKIDFNQCSELSEERIQVLDSLGFIWDTMLHENGRRWHQRYEELKLWKDEHGHCNVPQSTSLGQWVKIQRENKREADLKAQGKLPQRTKPKPCLAPDRIDKLNGIGFQWRVAAPVTGWDNRYAQLLEYAKTHNGDVNVPQYYPADKAFGRWVMKQRSEYSLRLRGLKSQLTDERVERLNAIGFSWVAPNFKRKVGVGIAPGSPAANVAAAAAMQQTPPAVVTVAQPVLPVAKLPPMEKPLLTDPPETLPQPPIPAAAAAAPPPPPPAPPLEPQQQQQPQPPPILVHHAHHAPPAPMVEGEYQHLHDPHHTHHLPQPPQDPTNTLHHHHHHPHHVAQPPQPHHETMGEDGTIPMEFL